MNMARYKVWVSALWLALVVMAGAILTSFHQPFRPPNGTILTVVKGAGGGRWRMVHVLSGSCGCSRRVMLHLLQRRRLSEVEEQVLLVDGGEPYLAETQQLLDRLADSGFQVIHLSARQVPAEAGIRGVPLLIVASPQDHVAYVGGYGERNEEDIGVLERARAGTNPRALPVLGCAVGAQLRRAADPFRFKY